MLLLYINNQIMNYAISSMYANYHTQKYVKTCSCLKYQNKWIVTDMGTLSVRKQVHALIIEDQLILKHC